MNGTGTARNVKQFLQMLVKIAANMDVSLAVKDKV